MFSQNNNVSKISKEFYEITLGKNRKIKKYEANEIEYIIKFKNIPTEMQNQYRWLKIYLQQ